MHAGAIMTPNPVTISPDAPVSSALRLLQENDCRHLPVLDEEGELVGMVSDRDLRGLFVWDPDVGALLGATEARLGTAVSALMSADVVTVTTATPLREVVDVFLDNRLGAVPVLQTDTGELAGIISYVDLLRALREQA